MIPTNEFEENKRAVQRLFDGVNARDFNALDTFFHTEYVNHNAFPGQTPGATGARIAVHDLLDGLPDISFTIEDVVAEGDKVVVRLTIRGTHKGNFRGVAPTGKSVVIDALEVFRMSGGKAIEGWMQWDMMGLMQQLGVLPASV